MSASMETIVEREAPHSLFPTPSSNHPGTTRQASTYPLHAQVHQVQEDASKVHRRNNSDERTVRHVGDPRSSASTIYKGSFNNSPRGSGTLPTAAGSAPLSRGTSVGDDTNLDHLLQDADLDLEDYGLDETRDGFFDASFFKPLGRDEEEEEQLLRDAEGRAPTYEQTSLFPRTFLQRQWRDTRGVFQTLTTTRAGIKLEKSFLAVLIAYILCLVPAIMQLLGRYSYIMVLSTIINHPGRTIGAQIDGTFFTIAGTATGLGWGSIALSVSDSTSIARGGYGGILVIFLIMFVATIAFLRSYYIRMYQFVLCAGISVAYTCLADTSESIRWRKLFEYAVPFLFGQVICLLVCCLVFPDAGARLLTESFHEAFGVMLQGFVLPHKDSRSLHKQLASTFVNLSQAYRDLVLDISITQFRPSDVKQLRNLMQGVIRSILSFKSETRLFDTFEDPESSEFNDESSTINVPPSHRVSRNNIIDGEIVYTTTLNETVIDIDTRRNRPSIRRTNTEERAVRLVAKSLAEPTAELLSSTRLALARCDAALRNMSGSRSFFNPFYELSTDLMAPLARLRKAINIYDEAEEQLIQSDALPDTYSTHHDVVALFLFVHPVRLGAARVETLLLKVKEMQEQRPGWRLYLPYYPLAKSLQRSNAQVRHDRGGLTAGYYFRSQSQLARTMKGMANRYKPQPRHDAQKDDEDNQGYAFSRSETIGKFVEEEDVALDRDSQATRSQRLRYKLWLIMHRGQGFETRFAFKVVFTTSLLSIPAWLPQSRDWWNLNESWWAVVMVWVMSDPRVGGNLQDLLTRVSFGIIGATWGGLAYAARDGNPYVMAAFAAVYMLPMMYRYTQSSHPRSGIVGAIAFVVVSLCAKANDGLPSVVQIAWTRGTAFVVGMVASAIVNWVLWPFVARHELRKALSAMLIYSSIIYRGVVAKYVYYEEGSEPGKSDIHMSEMLEGRLREGFVRIRQLMALTRYEIRLRGHFDPSPYSALIDSCESFFEYLVAVRQSSLFFHPHYISNQEQGAESLLSYRRDAVAAILMNLYVLAGALRGDRPVPRYLPSAALARKALLDHMAQLDSETPTYSESPEAEKSVSNRKWAQVYSYSYSQSLTGCVNQLEQLQLHVKEIVGEQGFDPMDTSLYDDLTEERPKAHKHGILDEQDDPRWTRR